MLTPDNTEMRRKPAAERRMSVIHATKLQECVVESVREAAQEDSIKEAANATPAKENQKLQLE